MQKNVMIGNHVESTENLHPVVRLNYIPRVIACMFLLVMCGYLLREKILAPEWAWLIVLALGWPHLAVLLCRLQRNSKMQELINMHLDCFFTASIVAILPSDQTLATTFVLCTSNAIYVGKLRLMATCMAVYVVTFVGVYSQVQQPWYPSSITLHAISTLFLLVYYGALAMLANILSEKLRRLNREVKELSIRDPLTQAYNRLYLDRELHRELIRCMRIQYSVTIIFADIDYFKRVNDDYGHTIGDQVLVKFVQIVYGCIRENIDWIARFGGEEFVIILPNAGIEGGILVAERLRKAVEKTPFGSEEKPLNITCSFGISSTDCSQQNILAEQLIKDADIALYRAKKNGRNRVELATQQMTDISKKAG